MAKAKKGARDFVALECPNCGNRNYRTSKNTRSQGKLELRKFCKSCRSHTVHKEKKK
jgi:large subunit ribosomal protein L33